MNNALLRMGAARIKKLLRHKEDRKVFLERQGFLEQLNTDPHLKLQALEAFLRYSRESRGIFKTVDENRELLQCLQERAPDILEKCPWIELWIAGTDIFLVNLMILFGLDQEQPLGPRFPRPWPGKEPIPAESYGYDIGASIQRVVMKSVTAELSKDQQDKS